MKETFFLPRDSWILLKRSCKNYKYAHACGNYCLATGVLKMGGGGDTARISHTVKLSNCCKSDRRSWLLRKVKVVWFLSIFYFHSVTRILLLIHWGKSVFSLLSQLFPYLMTNTFLQYSLCTDFIIVHFLLNKSLTETIGVPSREQFVFWASCPTAASAQRVHLIWTCCRPIELQHCVPAFNQHPRS